MNKRNAKRLGNRDEIEARVNGKWMYGYLIGEPRETPTGVYVSAITDEGYVHDIRHNDIR